MLRPGACSASERSGRCSAGCERLCFGWWWVWFAWLLRMGDWGGWKGGVWGVVLVDVVVGGGVDGVCTKQIAASRTGKPAVR